MATVDASRVTDGVLALLGSTGLLVGDGVPPTPADPDDVLALSAGYLVVRQVAAPGPYLGVGYAGQPEGMTRCRMEITAVGVQRDQAERAAERAANAIVARGPAGWVNPLTVTGHTVLDRARAGRYAPEIEAGAWAVTVLVDVTVHATT
jgi:hypothetical protein